MPEETTRDGPRTATPDQIETLQRIFAEQAGLCHKINNPLTSISGRAQILQMKHGDDPKLAKAIRVISESADRINAYVKELSQHVCAGRDEVGKG